MRIKHGLLGKIKKITGYETTYLCDLIATRKRPSFKRSKFLEEKTGVHHDLWLDGSAEELKTVLNRLEI